MRRKGLTRVLLVALVAVTVVLFARIFTGSSGDELIAFDKGIGVDELDHLGFSVHDRAVKVEIDATGSLQSDSVLAAYPWILNATDGTLVWILKPDQSERTAGMTVVEKAIITLEPGTYDAFFTSFGDPLRPSAEPVSFFDKVSAAIDSDFERWRTESDRWSFSIKALAETDRSLIETVSKRNRQEKNDNIFWSTGPLGSSTVAEYMFETARDLPVTVRCTGEFQRSFEDIGWIEDIETGDHIWDMTTASTEHAGGSIRNRTCREQILLPEGRFRAVFRTDAEHAFDDWAGNPPFDPYSWGMELSVDGPDDALAVAAFDPQESLPRIASLTGIGDDQLVSYTFTLEEPMRVLVHALGEGSAGRGKMFDYSWIVGAGDREVWKMTAEESKHAGGAKKNRRSETVLDLEAGIPYTVYYKTDGSHAYGDWNEDPPLHPEQWGVTLFALNPDYIPSIDVPVTPPVPPVPKPGFAATSSEPLVSLQSIGDDMNVSQQFTLTDSSSIHIYALGEMTRDGRYDWGWLTNLNTGAVVWEMRRENSVSAGGTSKNRLVDVVINLPPGLYEAHYVTDNSHAYPDFRFGGAPDNPSGWGISIQLVERGNPEQ